MLFTVLVGLAMDIIDKKYSLSDALAATIKKNVIYLSGKMPKNYTGYEQLKFR